MSYVHLSNSIVFHECAESIHVLNSTVPKQLVFYVANVKIFVG